MLITLLFFGKDLFGLKYEDSEKGFYKEIARESTCTDEKNPACEFDPDYS